MRSAARLSDRAWWAMSNSPSYFEKSSAPFRAIQRWVDYYIIHYFLFIIPSLGMPLKHLWYLFEFPIIPTGY